MSQPVRLEEFKGTPSNENTSRVPSGSDNKKHGLAVVLSFGLIVCYFRPLTVTVMSSTLNVTSYFSSNASMPESSQW